MPLKLTRRAAPIALALALCANVFGQQAALVQRLGNSAAPANPSAEGAFGAAGAGTGAHISPFRVGIGSLSSGGSGFSLAGLQSNIVIPGDNSIDENEYVIGAGDVFFISAVESSNIKYTAAVDQSGRAFIQNVGLVDVGKVTYAEAKKKIAGQISANLKNPSEIYVTLTQLKSAIVSFTGQVAAAGSYEFPGAMRLLDAIRIANNDTLPNPGAADLRQVHVTNGDTAVVYDVLAYLYKDDRSQNPYVYPGDRIRINPTTRKVVISGAIKTPPPGFYPIKENETLKAFMSLFTLDNTADTGNIVIFQTVGNSTKTISSAEDMYYALNDLDAITVPIRKNHPGIHHVLVSGEVASPGYYPIIENVTSVKQLIDAAGGMKESGNADQTVVIRSAKRLPNRFSDGAGNLNPIDPERGISIIVSGLTYDYTIIRAILYNADKITVEPDDRVHVPKKDRYVYISGRVKNPGAYLFHPGKSYSYYVSQAGGFGRNADRSNVQVYLHHGDIVQSIEPHCIESGSVIVVPGIMRYRMFNQVMLPIISAAATIVMAAVALYNIK